MAIVGRVVASLLGLLVAAAPSAGLRSSESLAAPYDRGIARAPNGWVVSGRNVLARVDERLAPVVQVDPAIPASWMQRGFDHVGDVDIAGTTLYVPFTQPDGERGRQAMARYDARTLEFLDATVVDQPENAFVAVDAESGIAYSMGRASGTALVRYDVRAGWRPLPPLRMSRSLDRVRGAAVARDAVWLMTDDDHHGMYRVDIDSGSVTDVGSAPPLGGAGAGIDAAVLPSGDLHATVVNADRDAVSLDHFGTTGEPGEDAAAAEAAAARADADADASWPPALVYFAILIVVVALAAVGTVFWRARTTIRTRR